MIKAGVTDPTRPFGVFLFVGPTGTGKTEIAKALAEFLFGSPDRMIRLDMSEFKTPSPSSGSLASSEGDDSAPRSSSIRKQPFSVVLLDEFEKAHPNVWDLFLQVFDDGRLTDRRGTRPTSATALIILTSNIGAAIQRGAPGRLHRRRRRVRRRGVERAVSASSGRSSSTASIAWSSSGRSRAR